MKIAEIYIEKKTKKKRIKLTFDYNQHIHTKIKSIKGRIYLYNSKTWLLPYNQSNANELLNLGFQLVDIDFLGNYSIKVKDIVIKNNHIFINTTDDITKYIILKMFTYFNYKSCFAFGKFDAKKAEKIELFHIYKSSIVLPIGFKQELFSFLNFYKSLDDWNKVIKDKRKKRKYKYTDDMIEKCLGYIKLRNYQVAAVREAILKIHGIIKLLPGTGKTEIFLALCKLMKIKTLILTNSIDLTQQTYDRGVNAGLDVGIVQGQNMDENHQVIMATIQSSHKLENKYEMVIVDECHGISLVDYNDILSNEDILYRFGFSATPFGKDKGKNAIVKQWIGDIIYTVDSKQLQEEKRIAIPNINIYKIDKPKLPESEKSYRNLEKMGIIHNFERNIKIIRICMEKKGQKLILVKKVEHGKLLQDLLQDCKEKIDSKFLHGGVKKKDRTEILKAFDSNKNEFILIGCKVLKQGISLNNINHLILAGAGSSYYETIQMIGRGLRVKTKKTVEIYDFLDNTHRILLKHSEERIRNYKKEGFDRINYIENLKDIYKKNYELKHMEE